MRIQKIYNNNIVGAFNENGEEIIVAGKGIGYQKKPGDLIASSKVLKIYRLEGGRRSQFEQLINDIPYSYIRVVEQIREMAENVLDCKLSDNIIITLTDHINFAVERFKNNLFMRNALLWEIKNYYPKEWSVSRKALELIKEELDVNLSEDEAGFIALHIINAELHIESMRGMMFPEVINEIFGIFYRITGKEIPKGEISYERFIVHIKFFLQRVLKNKLTDDDDFIRNVDLSHYSMANRCAREIKLYIEKKFECHVPEEEVIYLTIHIQRML